MKLINLIMAIIIVLMITSCNAAGASAAHLVGTIGESRMEAFGFTKEEITDFSAGGIKIFSSSYAMAIPSITIHYLNTLEDRVQLDSGRWTILYANLYRLFLHNHTTTDISVDLIRVLMNNVSDPNVSINESSDYGVNSFADVFLKQFTSGSTQEELISEIPLNVRDFKASAAGQYHEITDDFTEALCNSMEYGKTHPDVSGIIIPEQAPDAITTPTGSTNTGGLV